MEMAITYITDDVCEEVEICDPNEIVQNCLPEGEELECLYTVMIDVPYGEGNYWHNYLSYYDYAESAAFVNGGYYYSGVTFELDKVIKVDGNTGIQQERWLAQAHGGSGHDSLSGKGMLEYLNYVSGGAGSVASFYPSLYLGDLIHFELHGGAGNDFIEGANNSDRLYGDSGDDYILAWGGDDNVEGGTGADTIYGDDGNDILDGGSGDDDVYGGYGDDEVIGGLGNDYLAGNSGNDNLTGGDGYDTLEGGSGDDWMSGGADRDFIYGGDGDDCADGGTGDDYIAMGAGNDLAVGGEGDDEMWGGSGDDKLDGQDGDDSVYGGSGNDLVDGGAGDDLVMGGSGNDIVRGGFGDDTLWGGEGCDVFAFCDIDFGCSDIIEDFSAGRDPDQIDLSQLSQVDGVRVEMTGFDNMVRLDLLSGGEAVQQILVANDQGAKLANVFDRDTAYGTDDGALVKIAAGVMVDLPSTSVIFSDGDGMFF
jgi:Ca2+-binding RTX toxin-like protein